MQITIVRYIMALVFVGVALHQLSAQNYSALSEDGVQISEIVLEGNKITKSNIILRELMFSEGDTLERNALESSIEKSRENLLNLSIFNFVTIESEYIEDDRISILVSVIERWYIWPSPIFEHGERNLSIFLKNPRWDRLNYGLWLKWNNFRGRNELLNLIIRTGYKEHYALQFEKPNLGASENHKLIVSTSLSRQHRVNYITVGNRPVYFTDEENYAFGSYDGFIAYTYRPEIYSRHRLRFYYVNDWISDTVASLNPLFFGEGYTRYQHFKMDYVFNYDKRDSKIYPLEGNAFKVKVLRRGLGIIQSYPYGNWEGEAGWFLHRKLTDRLYIADVAKGKVSTRKEVPLYQQQAFGYTEYLTGYDDFIIDGTDYLINKVVLKYQLVKPQVVDIPFIKAKQFRKVHYSIYINLLGDIGYVNNKFPLPTNNMVNS
ncbi:POTRA domain-containing protein, partial [Bacteroidota bacterium]